MATITTRSGKGSPLTNSEVDSNFTNLNTDKVELDDISVGANASASGSGGLAYANSTGVFTYTPPDLSGYLTSYTVTQGDVTQHQAALSITESQISDFGTYLQNLSEDTSPQLGGNLDVNGHDIVTTSNADIELDPNGSGVVVFKGNSTKGSGQFKLNCEANSHAVTIKGPPHSANASYTLTLPNNDGDANQVLKTDGSGNLSWVAQAAGGASVTTSATAPASPSDGDLWFSETNGVTYVYYNDGSSSQWVASGAPVLEQFQAAGTNVGTLQTVTNNGASSSNAISVAGLTSNSITYPTTDGAADQVIKTNGSGTLSFDYPKTVHAFFKGASGTTTNIVSPSSAPTWNPINVSFSESASHPAADVSVDSNGYITVPTGTYLLTAMLYLQRSDTGAAITISVNTQYQGANKQTEYAMTLPAGTASAYETVSITCRTVVAYSSGSPPGNRYIYLDIQSAFTSTAAKLIGSGTNISLVRVG